MKPARALAMCADAAEERSGSIRGTAGERLVSDEGAVGEHWPIRNPRAWHSLSFGSASGVAQWRVTTEEYRPGSLSAPISGRGAVAEHCPPGFWTGADLGGPGVGAAPAARRALLSASDRFAPGAPLPHSRGVSALPCPARVSCSSVLPGEGWARYCRGK